MKIPNEKTITRANHSKEHPYTVISNSLIQSDLTPTAKIILIDVLSKVDFYKFRPTVFYKKYSRKTVDNAISELIQKGYCIKQFINKRQNIYYFFENPVDVPRVHLINSPDVSGENKFDVPTVHLINSEDVPEEHLRCTDSTPEMYPESISDVPRVHLINTNLNTNLISNLNNNLGKLEIENPNLTESDNTPIDLDFVNFERDDLPYHLKREKEKSSLMVKPENKSETNKIKMKIKREFTLKKKELIQNAIKIGCEGFQIKFEDKIFDKWYNWKVGLDGEGKVLSFEALLGSFKTFSAKDKGETPDQPTKSTRAVQIEEKEGLRLLAEDRKRKEEYKDAVKKHIYDMDLKRWESEGLDKAATKLLQRIQIGLEQFDKYPFEDWKKVATTLRNNILNNSVQDNLSKIK